MKKITAVLLVSAALVACGQSNKPAPQSTPQAATQQATPASNHLTVMVSEGTSQALEQVLKERIAQDKVLILPARYSPNVLTLSSAHPSLTSVSFMTDANDRIVAMSTSFMKITPTPKTQAEANLAQGNATSKEWLDNLFIGLVNPEAKPAIVEVLKAAQNMSDDSPPVMRTVGNLAVVLQPSKKTPGMISIGVMEAPK